MDVDPEAGCVQNVTLIWSFGVFKDFILMYVDLFMYRYVHVFNVFSIQFNTMYFRYSEILWINLLAYLVCVKIKSCRNDELGY